MKYLLILFIISPVFLPDEKPYNMEKHEVEHVVRQFTQAADERRIDDVGSLLHDQFRVVINRAFGSDDLSVMTRDVYMDMLRQGKLGGDSREVRFDLIDVLGNNALVKVRLKGKQMTFTSYLSLVKTKEGKWLIVNDQPHVEKS